jgi:hypothetical protein
MSKDFPCICGHSKEVHASYIGKCESTIIWKERNGYLSCGIFCEKYVPDNLKYIQQIQEERELQHGSK